MHQQEQTDLPDLRTPTSPEALGFSQTLMEDLLLRRAVMEGRTPMTRLAEKLHVSIDVVDALLNSMRERRAHRVRRHGGPRLPGCGHRGRS